MNGYTKRVLRLKGTHMHFKVLMLILLSLSLCGCTSTLCILNGLDHLFTQSPKPIPGVFKMTLTNRDNGDNVTCIAEIEHFYDGGAYDGGASARGNRWEVRYKNGVAPEPLKTKNLQGNRLEVPFPLASRLLYWDVPYSNHYIAPVIKLTLDQDLTAFGDFETGRYYYYTPVHREKIWIDLNLHIDVTMIN